MNTHSSFDQIHFIENWTNRIRRKSEDYLYTYAKKIHYFSRNG